MLGNDIVDLQEVLSTRQARRPGFSARIADPVEYSQLPSHLSMELKTWLLWAIKESAYKCYIQAGGSPLFAPKRFVFTTDTIMDGVISGTTRTPNGDFQSSIQTTEDFLLAESWSVGKVYENIISRIEKLGPDWQSAPSKELRRLLYLHFAHALQVAAEDLEIRKSVENIPSLFWGEERLPYSFSLAHHGAFGVFSYYPENSPFLGENGL